MLNTLREVQCLVVYEDRIERHPGGELTLEREVLTEFFDLKAAEAYVAGVLAQRPLAPVYWAWGSTWM